MKTFVRTVEETISLSRAQWDELTDEERETWTPQDGTDEWPPEPEPAPKLSKDELQLRMNKNAAKTMTENLRMRPGQKLKVADGKIEVVKWGPRVILVKHTSNRGNTKFATMLRKTEDSSYGRKDIMDFYPSLVKFETQEQAEQEFVSANG